MSKIHTRQKRIRGIRSTTRKHRFWFTSVEKQKGPKSFSTKELAQVWAKEQGIDTSAFVLYALKNKFQWRKKPRV